MAKYEKQVTGNFNEILEKIHNAVIQGSATATFEDGSEYHEDGIDFSVRVYERYSLASGNRVSLTISLVGGNNQYLVSAITSGGSRAIFLKVNTLGEDTFLDTIKDVLDAL